MINKAILIGGVGKQPELKYTASGQAVCNLSLATSEKYSDKQGNKQEKTEWHNIVLFGKQAELAAQYLDKGSKAYIEGKLQTRKWQGKDGSDHYTTEIVASEIKFLSPKGDSKPQNKVNEYQQRIDLVNAEKAKLAKARANDPGMSYNQPSTIEEDQFPF